MIKATIQRFLNRCGFELSSHRVCFSPAELDLAKRVRPYTACSLERIAGVKDAVQYITANRLAGAFVECGVWRGGSVMAAMSTLIEAGDTSREFYLYDTFEGMSEPTDADVAYTGQKAAEIMRAASRQERCVSPLEEVKRNLESTGYPPVKIHLIKGKVEDTLPRNAPPRIAFLRLDTDWYESTKHELTHLYPLLCSHGVLIVDDYGHWKGSRLAVDEYFARHALRPFLSRQDYTGRLAIKPSGESGSAA